MFVHVRAMVDHHSASIHFRQAIESDGLQQQLSTVNTQFRHLREVMLAAACLCHQRSQKFSRMSCDWALDGALDLNGLAVKQQNEANCIHVVAGQGET